MRQDTTGRVIALDVGTRRIGVAVSDEERRLALPLETVDARSKTRALHRILALAEDYDATEFVVGWPLEMSGREGRAVDRVRALVEGLKEEMDMRSTEALKIHRWDERMSTMAADRLLTDAQVSRRRRKNAVDQVAACKILEGFLAQATNGESSA